MPATWLIWRRACLPAAADDDLIEELRSHLEDCAYNLRLQGLSPLQSEQEALRRFGEPDDLVSAYTALPAQHHPGSIGRRWRARGAGLALVLALASAATLGGGMAAAAFNSDHPASAATPRHSTVTTSSHQQSHTAAEQHR